MEISKMLTISTGHVKESTLDLLAREVLVANFSEIGVYEKGDYGFILYLTGEELMDQLDQLPADLAAVVEFALNAGCNVLCLDCDGEELYELTWYNGDAVERTPKVHSSFEQIQDQSSKTELLQAVTAAVRSFADKLMLEHSCCDSEIEDELLEFFTPDQIFEMFDFLQKEQETEEPPVGNHKQDWFYPEICDSCTNINGALCGSCVKLGGNVDLYAKRPSCEDAHGPCYKCRHCAGWWDTDEIREYLRETVKEYFKNSVHYRHIDADGKAHLYMCPPDSFQQTVWNHLFGSEDHDISLYEEVIQDLQPDIQHYKEYTFTKVLEVLEAEIRDVPYFQEEDLPDDGKAYLKELISEYAVFEMPSHRQVFLWFFMPYENLWDQMDIEKIMAAGANDHSLQARMVVRSLLHAASKEDREKYCDKLSEMETWVRKMTDLFQVTEMELKYFCIHKPRTVFHWIFE